MTKTKIARSYTITKAEREYQEFRLAHEDDEMDDGLIERFPDDEYPLLDDLDGGYDD